MPDVRLEGIVPVILVPFLADDSIDAERQRVITIAIDQARHRLPVIAQANHVSARVAAGLARQYEQMGADIISFALPRQFGVTPADMLDYCGTIANTVSCPLLVQDFNPGGPTVPPEFIATAHERHPNITYFKLEEPMIMDKVVQVRAKSGDRVGILGGWGAYYMLESVAAGMCGFMPGVPICDLLDRVFRAAQAQQWNQAFDLFGRVLPYIAFSLQDFETFLQMEKRLMVRRGIFTRAHCRPLTRTLSSDVSRHVDLLLDQTTRVLEDEQLDLT